MNTETEQAVQKAKNEIMQRLRQGVGGYTNNAVGAILKDVMEKHGIEHSNRIVREMKLERLLGIGEVK